MQTSIFRSFRTSFGWTKIWNFEIPLDCPDKFFTDQKLTFWDSLRLSRQVLNRPKIYVLRFPQTDQTCFGWTKNWCFEIPSDCQDKLLMVQKLTFWDSLRLSGQLLDRLKIYVSRFPLTVRTSFGRTKKLRFEIPEDCLDKFWMDQKLKFLDSLILSGRDLDRLKIDVSRFPQTVRTSFGRTKKLFF